jgi:rhodanese-related sulfurtransferase
VVFYGARRGSREPIDAVRKALGLGIRNPGYLTGGVQEWVREGRALVITPGALAKGLGADPFTVLDLRERERALAGTIPGAISAPLGALRSQDFSDGRTLPVLILMGEDAFDETPFNAAAQVARWGELGDFRRLPRIRILEGGWKGWSAEKRKVASGASVPTALSFALGPGELSLEEFRGLHAADPGPGGPLLLDVSGRAARAWGMSIRLTELVDRLGELPRDREIVPYCFLGKRAELARAILAGFRTRFLNGAPPP